MPTREWLAAVGLACGLPLVRQFGEDVRRARLAGGVSQARVAAATGISQQTLSRYELGQPPFPDFVQAARIARIVGLDLRIQCFVAGNQLRDVAHVALIRRFLARIPSSVIRHLEAPVRPGDQRAWDVLIVIGSIRIGVIAETRIRALQALLRREHRKQEDGQVDMLILLVAQSKNNRAALREAKPLVTEAFPLGPRAVMRQLGRGEAPSASGVVVI